MMKILLTNSLVLKVNYNNDLKLLKLKNNLKMIGLL